MPSTVETPSGKGSSGENFPVGSWLLPARLRPHVATFYAFARAIDDIADNPALAPVDKIARLDGFAAAILGHDTDHPGYAKAHSMRESLARTNVPPRHCLDLIAAFKQDAVKPRYRDWDDLMSYCALSAAPVGRYLLDLHGESRDGYQASDPLCNALQVINHLQDCQDDYRELGRVYLPQDWMAAAGATDADLDAEAASAGLRQVLDRTLEATEGLMVQARELAGRLEDRRLAMESATIVEIVGRLIGHLRRRDPLAERVVLGKPTLLRCVLVGIWRAWT